MTLGERVAVADVQCEIAKSVLNLPGVRAAHRSANNENHKADQDNKNLQRLVEAHNVLTYTKHGSVMAIHREIAKSVLGLTGVRAVHRSADNMDRKAEQDDKNLLRLVEVRNVPTYTKHGSVMPINGLIAN